MRRCGGRRSHEFILRRTIRVRSLSHWDKTKEDSWHYRIGYRRQLPCCGGSVGKDQRRCHVNRQSGKIMIEAILCRENVDEQRGSWKHLGDRETGEVLEVVGRKQSHCLLVVSLCLAILYLNFIFCFLIYLKLRISTDNLLIGCNIRPWNRSSLHSETGLYLQKIGHRT